ncbi:isochorismatase family protein [Desulfurivibrio sp. D14AmB]|uniref:isochorismatase family protein n=1 Tax=Desulfurivibrio sp. D14AmB TaxID=3374370 RepID=UPI00376EBBBC
MSRELYHLDPAHCALLVVDIQENLMKVICGREEVARNSALLLKAAKVLGIPVVATTQYVARIGDFVPEVKAELAEITPIDKLEFGCFNNEAARNHIRGLGEGIDTLIVCGVETHICIYQTVLGALLAGFRVWVPADAVSSRTEKNYQTGLARLREIGAVVANSEMIIYDWLGKAGTPAFKQLLPSLK